MPSFQQNISQGIQTETRKYGLFKGTNKPIETIRNCSWERPNSGPTRHFLKNAQRTEERCAENQEKYARIKCKY